MKNTAGLIIRRLPLKVAMIKAASVEESLAKKGYQKFWQAGAEAKNHTNKEPRAVLNSARARSKIGG